MINLFPDTQTFISLKLGSLVLDIRWYAVLIMTGALLAYYFIKKEIAKVRYVDNDFFDSLFVYTLWVGILGARLWFCIFYDFSYYMSHPLDIIRIWDGGLAIQGGLVAGAIFAYFYCKKNRYSFLKMVDCILPSVLLAQAIGRWGNFVNKECHGGEVSESYFRFLPVFIKNGMNIGGHYYEPLFLVESVLCFIGFILIYFVLSKKQNKRGDLAYAYLMWYGLIRFFIEGKRTDSLYLGNLKMAQLTSIVFFIFGVLGYFGVLNRFYKKEKPTIIFDFDGTLVDTRKGIEEAYRALFKKYSDESKFTDEVKNEIIGPALKDLFPKYFPGIDYDTLYEVYHKRQQEVSKKTNKTTPNSVEVLNKLHKDGYKIGILSTRSKEGIERILKDFNLENCIDDICGLRNVEHLKPNPEGIFKLINDNKWNRECVMIGDSLMDVNCGLNYGAYTIAYLNDPLRSEELSKVATRSITDMNELLDILNSDISFTYNNK